MCYHWGMSLIIFSSAVDRGPSFPDWFDALPAAKAAKVAQGVEMLARKGRAIGDAIGKDLVEFGIPGLPGVRVYAGWRASA